MLEGKYQRGFTIERLSATIEPRVKRDERGLFLYTLSENVKVYFEDYYSFLEGVYDKCQSEMDTLAEKIEHTPSQSAETLAYYRARMIVTNIVRKTALHFYIDGANFGVIMTPWCFGTVALEKIEVYRDRMARGDVQDPNAPEYPFYVIRYVNEIYKSTLLALLDFPEQAFQMRWQYSELVRRYSKILGNINDSLNSVLLKIRNYQS